jgi:hypothetical protein
LINCTVDVKNANGPNGIVTGLRNSQPQENLQMASVLKRFEVLGELYRKRFGRLRPGKDESPQTYRGQNADRDNAAQFNGWVQRGALDDAVNRIVELDQQNTDLTNQNEAYFDLLVRVNRLDISVGPELVSDIEKAVAQSPTVNSGT